MKKYIQLILLSTLFSAGVAVANEQTDAIAAQSLAKKARQSVPLTTALGSGFAQTNQPQRVESNTLVLRSLPSHPDRD